MRKSTQQVKEEDKQNEVTLEQAIDNIIKKQA